MSAVKYAAIFFVILFTTTGSTQADVGELKIGGRKPATEQKKQAPHTTKKHKQLPAASVPGKRAVVIIHQPCPPAPQPQCSMAAMSRTVWQQFNKKVKEETPHIVASVKEVSSKIARYSSAVLSRVTANNRVSERAK